MRRALTYLGISMGLSFASAITYVIVMTLTLPKTDLAHGQMPFADPLVLPIMTIVAGISGIVGWPLFVAFGWRVRPATIAKVTGVAVLGFIIVATPFDAAFGWPGSYIVCILALLFCTLAFRTRNGEPCAAPNGGPAASAGNSGVAEGPPSVS